LQSIKRGKGTVGKGLSDRIILFLPISLVKECVCLCVVFIQNIELWKLTWGENKERCLKARCEWWFCDYNRRSKSTGNEKQEGNRAENEERNDPVAVLTGWMGT